MREGVDGESREEEEENFFNSLRETLSLPSNSLPVHLSAFSFIVLTNFGFLQLEEDEKRRAVKEERRCSQTFLFLSLIGLFVVKSAKKFILTLPSRYVATNTHFLFPKETVEFRQRQARHRERAESIQDTYSFIVSACAFLNLPREHFQCMYTPRKQPGRHLHALTPAEEKTTSSS